MSISKPTLILLIALISYSTQIEAQNTIDTTTRIKSVYNIMNNPGVRLDSVSLQNKEEIIKQLTDLDFISGAIYFSGVNFGNVVSTSLRGKGSGMLKEYIDRCIAGSRISFDKCNVKKSDGTKAVLHKSIIFR